MNWFNGLVLGIETSCDETSVAILDGHRVLANIVTSQIDMHAQWGGVVPEAASRAHVEAMLPALEEAFRVAGVPHSAISGIAVTHQPGLIGALSVGVTTAKALCMAWNVPLIGVHHLEGHILSVLADREEPLPFPHACLVVSGGHTELIHVQAPGSYQVLSETIDDAAGEAFDKGARLLGLGYPGGYRVQEAARSGNPLRYSLPVALRDDPFHFSFSGLKTAVLRLTEREGPNLSVPDAAACLQAAIVKALVTKSMQAVEHLGVRAFTLVGGVAANLVLRQELQMACHRRGVSFATPAPALCTDNAAMIAVAGSLRLAAGQRSDFQLEARPNAPITSVSPYT